MNNKISAGILVYRFSNSHLQVLLAHPGGPFWKKKDAGAWTIPKGEVEPGENLADAALRVFAEETSLQIPLILSPLSPIVTKSGKTIYAFAVQHDPDLSHFKSNTCSIEYPYRSGRKIVIPEIDKIQWFSIPEANIKIIPSQLPLLVQLSQLVRSL